MQVFLIKKMNCYTSIKKLFGFNNFEYDLFNEWEVKDAHIDNKSG